MTQSNQELNTSQFSMISILIDPSMRVEKTNLDWNILKKGIYNVSGMILQKIISLHIA